jgi:hypothetical protein
MEGLEIKKPSLIKIISANIKFWIWAAMHSPRYWGKEIIFGFRKPLIEINCVFRSKYYITWEIIRYLNTEFGVKVPMPTITAYEKATNTDTSLIWK